MFRPGHLSFPARAGLCLLIGCGDGSGDGAPGNTPADPDRTPSTTSDADASALQDAGGLGGPGDAIAQTPPEGRAALDAWLAAGHYRGWKCEPEVMNARPNGAHGRNRICSNDLASAHGAGPYPVGAAAVKELYGSGSTLLGYAVARKRRAGTSGADWYWYERAGGSIYADGAGVGLCTGCHALAQSRGGNDYVYVQVR